MFRSLLSMTFSREANAIIATCILLLFSINSDHNPLLQGFTTIGVLCDPTAAIIIAGILLTWHMLIPPSSLITGIALLGITVWPWLMYVHFGEYFRPCLRHHLPYYFPLFTWSVALLYFMRKYLPAENALTGIFIGLVSFLLLYFLTSAATAYQPLASILHIIAMSPVWIGLPFNVLLVAIWCVLALFYHMAIKKKKSEIAFEEKPTTHYRDYY